MIRIAAVGDIHLGTEPAPALAEGLAGVGACADVLLLAGDLTRCGRPDEARRVVATVSTVRVPVVAVLGNHDHHHGTPAAVVDVLRAGGLCVLDGEAVVIDLPGGRLGVAGAKGFGGGFGRTHATSFGEPEMKAFVEHAHASAANLSRSLAQLEGRGCDVVVALLHYSPVADTLAGEPREIFPFLGSELLAEAVDTAGVDVDLVLHGHAHAGSPEGRTAGGVPVRNVAMPVLGCSHRVFELAVPARVTGFGGAPSGVPPA